MNYEFILHELS